MLVAALRVDLRIPGCGSLKEKRHVLKTLTNGIRSTFPVAVAETGYQDTWQRATLAIAYVSADAQHAKEVVTKALDFVENTVEGNVLETFVEIL